MKDDVDSQSLEFAPNEWPINDVSALLQGLFQADQSKLEETLTLLRKLRLHTLRGHPNERVSVADDVGQLGELFSCWTPGIRCRIPATACSLWREFLSETKIVEQLPANPVASAVREEIFRRRAQMVPSRREA